MSATWLASLPSRAPCAARTRVPRAARSLPSPCNEPDVIRLGFLRAAERQTRPDAEERLDPQELPRRERDASGDDRGCDLGQVIALDPLGDVLGRSVRDLVPEHRCEPGIVPGERQDAGVDDDLPAGQAEGVRLVLRDQAHLPDEVRLVPARNGLDAPRDPLHLGVLGSGRDDPCAVLTQRLGVFLCAELHLLRVGERDVLDAVRHRRLLAVRVQQHHADHRRGKSDRHQWATDQEAEDRLRGAAHAQNRRRGAVGPHRRDR